MKEFIEKLIEKLEEEIQDVSESQSSYESGSDMSITCSHIMGTLRDVKNRIIPKLAEEYKQFGNSKQVSGWISVTERLPEHKTTVLICSGEFVHEACFEDGHFSNAYGMWYKAVTHWQPLPVPFRTEKSEWKDKVMKHFTKIE